MITCSSDYCNALGAPSIAIKVSSVHLEIATLPFLSRTSCISRTVRHRQQQGCREVMELIKSVDEITAVPFSVEWGYVLCHGVKTGCFAWGWGKVRRHSESLL